MSFINKEKRRGLRTQPRGIPDKTGSNSVVNRIELVTI